MAAGKANHLDIFAFGQVQLQVFADKTIGAGNQYLHVVQELGITTIHIRKSLQRAQPRGNP
ncbi:MAG: hypothetical protein ABIR56_04840 [Polaromonas sp.]